jgi:hypothetical protein
MEKRNFEEWCEVDCAKYIHSKLEESTRLKLYPETIIILLYKKHEHEVLHIDLAQSMPESAELTEFTIEKRLFPHQKEFLNKLGLETNEAFLNRIIELEQEYNDLFDWSEFEEELETGA